MKTKFCNVLVLICICYSLNIESRNVIQVKNIKNVINNDDSLEINSSEEVNPNLIIGKTFYRITATDSCDVIIDRYVSGINGIIFTIHNWINFGAETSKFDIDSIRVDSSYLTVFTSETYHNIFNELEKDTSSFKISTIKNRPGYIEINHVSILIDSIYANEAVPIIKEEPYDIEKAIGDY